MANKKVIGIFVFLILLTTLTSAQLPTCSDSNEIDISDIPCVGLTVVLNCSNNITVFNSTDASINESINMTFFSNNIYNFTFNQSKGGYELLDCGNNTATVIVGLFDQGYGINMFGIMIPALILCFSSLWISGRLFRRMGEADEEQKQRMLVESDSESFVPRNRLIPIVFLLFAFVPILFMIGFVNNYLTEYMPTANITSVYGMFFVLMSYLFYGTFLIMFIIWLSYFIKTKKISRGLIDGVE